ncbi:hypothetical protein D3C72_1919950 [compost metagenome]
MAFATLSYEAVFAPSEHFILSVLFPEEICSSSSEYEVTSLKPNASKSGLFLNIFCVSGFAMHLASVDCCGLSSSAILSTRSLKVFGFKVLQLESTKPSE